MIAIFHTRFFESPGSKSQHKTKTLLLIVGTYTHYVQMFDKREGNLKVRFCLICFAAIQVSEQTLNY